MDNPVRPAIVDEIWAMIKENQQGLKVLRQSLKELRESQKKTDEQQKKTDQQLAETSKQLKETDARFNTQWGSLVESLFAGKLVDMLKERGIKVHYLHSGTEVFYKKEGGGIQKKEFDLSAVNGSEVVLVEVKTTLTPGKVKYFLKAMRDSKKYFPGYSEKKVYGAMAFLRNESEASLYAERQGLFVIKATGDSAQIINADDFKPKAF